MIARNISKPALAKLLKEDFNKTIDVNYEWTCNFCGDSWFEVLRRRVYEQYTKKYSRATLKDRITQTMYFYYSLSVSQFCCKSCFYNYRSHELTHIPKTEYIKYPFYCQFCGRFSNGGRWQYVSRLDEKLRMCRVCMRKKTISKAIKLWELQHRESRNHYHREWNHKNPHKHQLYKRRYRESLKNKPPLEFL